MLVVVEILRGEREVGILAVKSLNEEEIEDEDMVLEREREFWRFQRD